MTNHPYHLPGDQNHRSKPTLYFSDAVVVRAGAFVYSAGFLQAPDARSSTIMFQFDERWAAHPVSSDFIVSLAYSTAEHCVYALGKNGLVKKIGPAMLWELDSIRGRFLTEKISNAGDIGPLECVVCVADRTFCCGWNGQIYHHNGNSWDRMPLPSSSASVNLLSIHGIAPDNIYAVGMGGAIVHFDGNIWMQLDSPTNCHFYDVCVASNGTVYLCGSNGALYAGDLNGFAFIGDEALGGNFWAVQTYLDEVFVTHANRDLFRITPSGLIDVSPAAMLGKPLSTNRLAAADGQLVSVGAYDICVQDGSRWVEIVCPENA